MKHKEYLEKNNIKIHSSVVVWSKGQIVIPKSARDILNIVPWDDLMIITKWQKFLWVIKSSDIEFFSDYLNQHLKNGWENI